MQPIQVRFFHLMSARMFSMVVCSPTNSAVFRSNVLSIAFHCIARCVTLNISSRFWPVQILATITSSNGGYLKQNQNRKAVGLYQECYWCKCFTHSCLVAHDKLSGWTWLELCMPSTSFASKRDECSGSMVMWRFAGQWCLGLRLWTSISVTVTDRLDYRFTPIGYRFALLSSRLQISTWKLSQWQQNAKTSANCSD